MDSNTYEKLLYLLNHMDGFIEQLVYDVLTDSQTDPHYSAVTATNLIKCYIQVMNRLNKEIPYTDIRSYFKYNLLTDDEYEFFEKSRRKESKYYVGKQY